MRFLLGLLLFTTTAFGLITAYVTFEHPEGWKCELSQGVWICQSTVELDRRESIVLSIAATASEFDTLDNYVDYLKKSRRIETEDGKTLTSTIRYVRKRKINGKEWVDSLQKNSELPGFWARYLATVHTTKKAKLAVLITYIVSEDSYGKMAQEFERMIASLKLNDNFDMNVKSDDKGKTLPGGEILGSVPETKNILKERLGKRPEIQKTKAPSYTMEILGVALIIGVFLFLKKKKKKA